MKVSTRGAVCDGETMRKVESEVLEDHGRS
jgi:hypothetical protein